MPPSSATIEHRTATFEGTFWTHLGKTNPKSPEMEDLRHKLRPVVSSLAIIEHRTATLEDTFWTNLGSFRRDLGALISQMLITTIIIINLL